HYDGNHLTNHVAVNFKIDRWVGSGGALDMDVPGEMLRLYDKVDATMAPETPADSPLNVKSQEGFFRRKENVGEFTKDVVATRDAVVVDLRGGDLHAVARRHAHAAFSVGFFRVAVELRLRADQLVRQAGRAIDRHLHVLERVPARLKRDHALGTDSRG